MAEYPHPGPPSQAAFFGEMALGDEVGTFDEEYGFSALEITLAAVMSLAAFGMIGYGAFFETGTAIPALNTAATITYGPGGIVVGTTTFVTGPGVTLTAGQMGWLAQIGAGGISLSNGAVAAILESWGLTTMSVDGFLALAAYESLEPFTALNSVNMHFYLNYHADGRNPGDAGPGTGGRGGTNGGDGEPGGEGGFGGGPGGPGGAGGGPGGASGGGGGGGGSGPGGGPGGAGVSGSAGGSGGVGGSAGAGGGAGGAGGVGGNASGSAGADGGFGAGADANAGCYLAGSQLDGFCLFLD